MLLVPRLVPAVNSYSLSALEIRNDVAMNIIPNKAMNAPAMLPRTQSAALGFKLPRPKRWFDLQHLNRCGNPRDKVTYNLKSIPDIPLATGNMQMAGATMADGIMHRKHKI